MSKIICDICGTSYPETAKQCPICGYVRAGDAQRVNGDANGGKVSTGYTYVKGGRFSKSNVKKRTSGAEVTRKSQSSNRRNDTPDPSERGLVITAIVLLLAIIGVVIYIALRFFAPISDPNAGDSSTPSTQQNQVDLSCKDIILDTDSIVLEQFGEARLLSYTLSPVNTSDKVTFKSENIAIATVSDKGNITAVGEGTTKIVVTCGNIVKECEVICQFTEESTTNDATDGTTDETIDETTDETTGEEQNPTEELRLNRKDMTLGYKGEEWVLYTGTVPKNLVTWTSDNEAVATFVDGKVVAVGNGMTTVHAEFGDQKVSCIVRCNFKDDGTIGGNGGVSEDGGNNGGVTEDGGNSSAVTGTVNVQEFLNVRKEPSTSSEIVTKLGPNAKVTITEQKTVDGMVWGKISDGWISMNYVILDN